MNHETKSNSEIRLQAANESLNKLGYAQLAEFLKTKWDAITDSKRQQSFLADLEALAKHAGEVKKSWDASEVPHRANKSTAETTLATFLNDTNLQYLGEGDFSIVFKSGNDAYKYMKDPLSYLNTLVSRLCGEGYCPGERHAAYWSKFVNNDKLIATISDIPGQPIEKAELALPLDKALKAAEDHQDVELIDLIKEARAANPLFSEGIIEANETDKLDSFGLVVRTNALNEQEVYIVALDLDYMNNLSKNPDGEQKLKNLVSTAQPKPIPLDRLKRSIPEITKI